MASEFAISSTEFIKIDDVDNGLEWWKSALVCGTIAGVCGFGVMFCGMHNAYISYRINNRGLITKATILSKMKDTHQLPLGVPVYRIRFMYCDYMNRKRYGIAELSFEEYEDVVIGEQVNIKYDPLNPNISSLMMDYFDENGNNITSEENDIAESRHWLCKLFINNLIGISVIFGCIYYVTVSTYNDQLFEALFATLIISILLSMIVLLVKCYDSQTFWFSSSENKAPKSKRISTLDGEDEESDDSEFDSQDDNVRIHVSIQGTDTIYVIVDILCPEIRDEFCYNLYKDRLEDAVQSFVDKYECLEYEAIIKRQIIDMVENEMDGYQTETDYAY